ncbi:ferritin-like-domain-containing protein [Mycena galopus ATCC 62051]|nr:ferritin-like-domain-containing protein [Mycena galopus ATCC 62051]
MAIVHEPVYRAPTSPPDWNGPESLEQLKRHLQTAVILELHTIPLYLFAAYSIKGNALSTYKIISVVKQEMLHLALSGNVLTAIGGEPKVYGEEYTPQFPAKIFYDKTQLDLKPATLENMKTFQRLEEPISRLALTEPRDLLPEYHSIGEFYEETLRGLRILNQKFEEEGKQLFLTHTCAKQFQTADGSWYDDDMMIIDSIQSAEVALNIVIQQGEGSTGEPVKNTVQSHYQVFTELVEEHPLNCWDVIENPKTSTFADQPNIHSVMLLSDAAYSYLLLTIQTLWTYEGISRQELVTNNIMNLMLTVQKPLSLFLVEQTLANGSHAASPFNLYKFRSPIEAHEELVQLADNAVASYPNVQELLNVRQKVRELIDLRTI